MNLDAVLSAGRLELCGSLPPGASGPPLMPLGEVEALVAYCRLEVSRHLEQRGAANSPDAKLALEEADADLLTALHAIGSAIDFIERDMEWWK